MLEKVINIIANQLDVDPSTITADTRLVEDLKADSLDIVELVMDMEQEFDIEIPDEELLNIHTIGDIIDRIGE